MFQNFIEAIFSQKTDLYREEIRYRNYKSFQTFTLIGMIIALLVFLHGLLLREVVTFNTEFFIMLCYCTTMFLISRYFLKTHMWYITPILYGTLTPLMILAILMGTYFDVTQPSITIMVFLGILPIFILDKPWRVILFITIIAVLYTICCYFAKTNELFIADMVDLIAFYILAVGVNYFSLNDRIESVENFIQVRKKSEIDTLTAIYNRGAGVEKIEKNIENDIYGAFIVLDIDDFKDINDNYGHICGDEILQAVAKTLKEYFKADDIVLRLGGDEFAVYAVDMLQKEECEQCLIGLFKKIKLIKIPSALDEELRISLGCSFYNGGSDKSFEALYKNSDESLYCAKNMGKGQYEIKE